MKLIVRSRGNELKVYAEDGTEIEGVVHVDMEPWQPGGKAPQFRVGIVGRLDARIEGEGELEELKPVPSQEAGNESGQAAN